MKKKSGSDWRKEMQQRLAERIIKSLESGIAPWRRPWAVSEGGGLPVNFASGKRYRGINPMLLWFTAEDYGFGSKYWGTIRQWNDIGASVTKGQKSTEVVFYKPIEITEEVNGEKKQKKIFMLRSYRVFNVEQVAAPSKEWLEKSNNASELAKKIAIRNRAKMNKDQLVKAIQEKIESKLNEFKVNKTNTKINQDVVDYAPAEKVIKETKAVIKHSGDKAFYSPTTDNITVPPKEQFEHMGHYYETVFHELSHWSEKRLGFQRSKNEEETYGFYELIAELSACYVCTELNVPFMEEMLPKSTGYLKGWLDQIAKDPTYVFKASTKASRVVDFLLGEIQEMEDAA